MNNTIIPDVFVIEYLKYFPMGASVPMVSRPHMINASNNAINDIAEKLNMSGAGLLTADSVSGVLTSIITPSAVGEATAIDNSWVTQRRYVFILKVQSIDALGATINSYFQGYTNYDGIHEPTGSVDKVGMIHCVNSVIETTYMEFNTPMGLQRKEKLHRIYNVFAQTGSEYYTQRPQDVIDNISLKSATDFLNDGGYPTSSANLGNIINPFNRNVISSTADNAISTDYLCKVINGGIQKQASREIFLNSYEISETQSTPTPLLEPDINDNRFMKALSRVGGFNTIVEHFTFSQLDYFDPTIEARFELILPDKSYMNPLLAQTPEVGDYWTSQDPVTLKAHSLIESYVALAMKYGFSRMCFSVSNMNVGALLPECIISDFSSLINLDPNDMRFLLEAFRSKSITDVFIGETAAGTIPMYLDMYVDLAGTSKIYLEYAGFQGNWYTIPTTANSLYSPVTTSNPNVLDMVTTKFSSMLEDIGGRKSSLSVFY